MATFMEKYSNIQIGGDVNILLLGETGVGKSTFINSFINYLQFDTVEEVCANVQNIHCLIPTKFTVPDDEFNERVLHFGSGGNESTAAGESATLTTKTYVFDLPNQDMKFRIIDTPGIGDTRGIMQDQINQENIINALSNIKYINGICILLKPDQPRCTIAFQYCINQLLMCLDKIAVNNILFIFTNTRNSFFTPGETVHSLQKILKDIEGNQNIIIPFNKENTFCVDNESFKYLLAQKSNVDIGNDKIFLNSWVHSHNEYLRIVQHTIKLNPYNIDYSLYLFKVRSKFEKLCQSLTDCVDLLKTDSVLLKKLQSIVDTGKSDDIDDAQNHINDVDDRINKCEQDKNNYTLQISKLVTFLQTNSIIVFNNYSKSYISYLIDHENTKGLSTDRNHVRMLYNLMKRYESINNIVKMDMHTDPFSPVMTREELSSVFPQLEQDAKIMYNFEYNDEVQFSIMQTVKNENCKKELTEENPSTFSFAKWFNVISDTALYIAEQAENSLDYEELEKPYIKKDCSNISRKYNVNKHNFTRKQIMKSSSNFDSKPNLNKSTNNDFFMVSDNTNSPISVKHTPKQNCYRGAKLLNTHHTSDFLHEHDFVVINSPQQTKSRGYSHGRGRGRGSQGYNRQSNGPANDTKSQSYNKIQQSGTRNDTKDQSHNKIQQSGTRNDTKNQNKIQQNATRNDTRNQSHNKIQQSGTRNDTKNQSHNKIQQNVTRNDTKNQSHNKIQQSGTKHDAKNRSHNKIQQNATRNDTKNQSHTKIQQNPTKNNTRSQNDNRIQANKIRAVSKTDNGAIDNPNNLLKSMKTLFD